MLSAQNLIEEMPTEPNVRRRYYRLTKKGWDRLNDELPYYETIGKLARERHILDDSGAPFVS